MAFPDDEALPETPGTTPTADPALAGANGHATGPEPSAEPAPLPPVDEHYGYYDDAYGYDHSPQPGNAMVPAPAAPVPATGGSSTPPPGGNADEEDEDDDGMLRMSFLEHLEELRHRLLRALIGVGIAFVLSLTFADELWRVIQEPAASALRNLGVKDSLVFTKPMEVFTIVWVKLPMLTAVFLSSPWLLYQVWSFVAPGLYRRERRWAAPFIVCSAGLFVLGGLFAYFVALRFGLTFLLGIGVSNAIQPMVTVTEYFDLFVNVVLGIAIVFELPVLVFFLTLLRIVTPSFLLRNSRYAILGIVVLAAVITPTPDVFNLMIFSAPMVVLFFLGIFASYLLELSRNDKRFPWGKVALAAAVPLLVGAAAVGTAVVRYNYRLVPRWPFLER